MPINKLSGFGLNMELVSNPRSSTSGVFFIKLACQKSL